ncbi:MAG: hypothetical protein RMJ37_05175 [Spirochaetia bacterium]|nr:hypothetical protein [Spirochaetota bacterium]MCX8096404.1 hypothetical protein [Spirochaetota bacterium]MDW8112711.1 hypothetical protein [Spirochaetia bacterium]
MRVSSFKNLVGSIYKTYITFKNTNKGVQKNVCSACNTCDPEVEMERAKKRCEYDDMLNDSETRGMYALLSFHTKILIK